jgi:transcriptional repressor NrdR
MRGLARPKAAHAELRAAQTLHMVARLGRRTLPLVESVLMDCPACDKLTRVLESRRAEDGAATRRRRECQSCGMRFTTFERRQREPVHVRKRGGARQRFDRAKLRAALLRSTHKRQVSAADVEALVDRVELAIESAGGELGADRVGELCVQGLRDLDYGAYLQFLGTLPTPNPEIAEPAAAGSVRGARKSASLPAEAG